MSSTNTITDTKKNFDRIILIGWDGAQRNHMQEALVRGDLPNLSQLISEGTLVSIDINGKTDTNAGWSQILTGYSPEITGEYSNIRYQAIPNGYTIFERLEQFFGADKIATVAAIGGGSLVGADPPTKVPFQGTERQEEELVRRGEQIIIEDGIKYRLLSPRAFYNAKDSIDVFVNGLTENGKVGTQALEAIDNYKNEPFFFFFHFYESDLQGHVFGENSHEYNDALISADSWLGKIVTRLKELNLYNDTLIYVTADHGFDEGKRSHIDAPYVFLATNDKGVIRDGERADIAPTILDRFGVDLNKLDPPLSGHSLLAESSIPVVFFDLTNDSDNFTFAPSQIAGVLARGLAGNDTIYGSMDAENINGNHGNDLILGSGGNDTLLGGQGKDTIYGNDGSDKINGNTGDDLLFGGRGEEDTLWGGQGNDTLVGDFSRDYLIGGRGNDLFILRTDMAVANAELCNVIADFGNGMDTIGLTGGITQADISLVTAGGSLPFENADTLIRLGSEGDFLGLVRNTTPGELVGRFTTFLG